MYVNNRSLSFKKHDSFCTKLLSINKLLLSNEVLCIMQSFITYLYYHRANEHAPLSMFCGDLTSDDSLHDAPFATLTTPDGWITNEGGCELRLYSLPLHRRVYILVDNNI